MTGARLRRAFSTTSLGVRRQCYACWRREVQMNLDPNSVVVPVASRRNARLAALYWDYIVPIYCDEVPRELLPPAFGDWTPTTATDLLRRMQADTGHKKLTAPVRDTTGSIQRVRLVTEDGEPDIDALEYVNQWSFVNRPEGQTKLRRQMFNARIERAPVLLSGTVLAPQNVAATGSEVTAILAGLPIVDVSKASWRQILEFRKDPEARRKLRILRLHLADQFIGKTTEQIAAGLELGIAEYERAAKKHGFELLVGSLQASCDAKDTIGAVGVWALVGATLGSSAAAAVIGASVGLLTELSKLTLSVAKGAYDLREFRKHHPYTYVVEAQSKLG
jgi:hypothetical protein